MDEISALKILEASPDAVLLISSQGKILWANRKTEDIFGFKNFELLNEQIELLLPKNLHSVHEANRNNFFSNPSMRSMGRGLKLVGLRKNGTEFRVEVSLSPINTITGMQVICTIRDLSEFLRV